MINNDSNPKEISEEKVASEDVLEDSSINSKNSKSKLSIKLSNFKSKIIKFPYLTSTLIAWIFIVLVISICICVGLKLI